MKHFETRAAALAYVMPELLATLSDDLGRMEGSEAHQYEDKDRHEMRNRIADLEEIAPLVTLRTDADREISAAAGQLLEQVYQMQGMFDDEDGAIARAIEDVEKALNPEQSAPDSDKGAIL